LKGEQTGIIWFGYALIPGRFMDKVLELWVSVTIPNSMAVSFTVFKKGRQYIFLHKIITQLIIIGF